MRNLLLSVALIALPVGVFAAGYAVLAPASPSSRSEGADATPLGDMSPFIAIVTDVRQIADTGDMVAAETRITDFETAWDDAQKTLRPVNKTSWGNVDEAADAALDALRADTLDPAGVTTTLSDLMAELEDPTRVPGESATADTSGGATVSGIATTDANGRALPCEVMLDQLKTSLASASLSTDAGARVASLQARGTERCNADDDARADDFFAQGLALTSK